MDRDCKTCAYSSGPAYGESNGCTAWDCEYIPRSAAIKAYHERKQLLHEKEVLIASIESMAKTINNLKGGINNG